MAHQLERKSDGTYSMVYVGPKPWHLRGQQLNSPPTSAEAIKAAGLDYDVYLDSLQTEDGVTADTRMVRRFGDGKKLGEDKETDSSINI